MVLGSEERNQQVVGKRRCSGDPEMDKEDEANNLPPDKPPKSLARPILNHESSSSSSSSSSPELIRHLQAAFKRHRPLSTLSPSLSGKKKISISGTFFELILGLFRV